MWIMRVALVGATLFALTPYHVFAEGEGKLTWSKPIYPYKNLPGVTAPQEFKEKFKCWTRLADLDFGYRSFYRDYPRLVYVCDQNGVISESTRPPNYSYWQYNNRNR
ncbi:hypothetical protein [Rhizobium tumorigenes]|uniref:Uncharacterized protein n=1 Tax=Rhizobium tumorigenes TaxID=2041385 RepID=A0AAF1KS69_9HYPH|nr:hypothetical protein [Rhizobium tumorigenes]WFR95410.1 hypothetical protein PR017_16810 [Rhizobium tumorigenes]